MKLVEAWKKFNDEECVITRKAWVRIEDNGIEVCKSAFLRCCFDIDEVYLEVFPNGAILNYETIGSFSSFGEALDADDIEADDWMIFGRLKGNSELVKEVCNA